SPYEVNATSYRTTAVIIVTLQAFAGMWINAFIVSALCTAWIKKRSFNSLEKILLFLGCSRFCYLCFTWIIQFLSTIYSWCFFVHPVPQLLAALQSFFDSSNLWVSACLCGFYCAKIANFRHILFTYLKVKIDRIVLWLLLGSVLLSLVFSILVYNMTDKMLYDNINSTTLANTWKPTPRMDAHFLPLFLTVGFIFSTAFVVVIFSALLLIFSLWRHKSNMQMNPVKNLSVEAHIKAMKNILSFLFIFSFHFTCLVLNMIDSINKYEVVTFFVLVFQYVFPTVHSLLLILSNPKLEKTLLKTLSCLKSKICMR
ncbi:TA2R9 protein, partial [Trogon melanurus]|nr:TA2R9 protein [Trogon melanurus]